MLGTFLVEVHAKYLEKLLPSFHVIHQLGTILDQILVKLLVEVLHTLKLVHLYGALLVEVLVKPLNPAIRAILPTGNRVSSSSIYLAHFLTRVLPNCC